MDSANRFRTLMFAALIALVGLCLPSSAASFFFDNGTYQLDTGAKTWTGGTVKARIMTGSLPAKTVTVMTGITAATGSTDWTATNRVTTNDTTNHRTTFGCDDPTWTSVAGGSTVTAVVFYWFVTDDADSIPIFLIDVTDKATSGITETLPLSTASPAGIAAYIAN